MTSSNTERSEQETNPPANSVPTEPDERDVIGGDDCV